MGGGGGVGEGTDEMEGSGGDGKWYENIYSGTTCHSDQK